jgi:PEP-CTERM motif
MKKIFAVMSMCALVAGSVKAQQTYNDATSELFNNAFTHLDISSVVVDSDAVNLYFSIFTVQTPINAPTDWGNYMIGIDSVAGGDTSANGNGWTRPISMSNGMDYWIGSWVNGTGGHQVWSYGGTWTEQPPAPNPRPVDLSGGSLNLVIPLADLGLSANDTFTFDVYTSGGGGGDGAVDALSAPAQSIADWSNTFDTGSGGLQYQVVPEPSTLALLGGAGLLAVFRRFRRK